ncbi:MAG: DUF1858 domain-containing protein [Nitrospirota bacterium]|jgi:hybrid cluster-associated redox disulfide protein
MATTEKRYTKDSLIGDVVKSSPEARAVIEKHFGNGCFTCPGMNVESLSFGCMMHSLDPEAIVAELNALGEGK